MQEMIRQIVEMDKNARRLTAEARERRAGSAQAIEQKKKEVSENYLSMARKRIDVIRGTEMADAAAEWEQREREQAQISARLNECYEKNREQWVSDIVARVISGEDEQ